METRPLILVCDDDELYRKTIRTSLASLGEVISVSNSDEALSLLKSRPIQVLLLDIQMRTKDEGLKVLPEIRSLYPDLSIIMCSGLTDYTAVREALQKGANDYLVKDFEQTDLTHVVKRVLEKRELVLRNEQQNDELLRFQKRHQMIGESPAIRSLQRTLDRIRNSPAHVVITGETGTGKEVVARNLRKILPDGSLAPFVAVDSSTIQSTMAESVLFGYEKGAFTGADRQKKGLFEEAQGGIIYFDEISNMPLDIQAKLLRVIQEKEVLRLGGTRVIHVEFRVVCATNKDLDKLVTQGLFKEDLYQRLNVIPLQLTPLRDRPEDLEPLIRHFLSRQAGNRAPLRITEDAIALLKCYSWPGNVRELENLIAWFMAMVEGDEVDTADLPPKIRDAARKVWIEKHPVPQENTNPLTFYDQVAQFEKNLLNGEFQRLNGNISKLALTLGMDRSHLYTKLRDYGIHPRKS